MSYPGIRRCNVYRETVCLATGYSCRSQVKRIEGTGVRHPLQALLEIIG
ncbi:FAD-binding protein [Salmonella enterica subsp. enterica]|uniref:FAD-binding protein n=1 Tax=Salmonella enterica I TaxID=59201 RepID=A0A3S4JFL8_SALET|nr:FAD-binding protein [Salmonella enterica subsp. enterica]